MCSSCGTYWVEACVLCVCFVFFLGQTSFRCIVHPFPPHIFLLSSLLLLLLLPPQDHLTRFLWSRSRRMTWTPLVLHWTSRHITVPTQPCTCAGTATPVCLCLITAWLWRYSSSAHNHTHLHIHTLWLSLWNHKPQADPCTSSLHWWIQANQLPSPSVSNPSVSSNVLFPPCEC